MSRVLHPERREKAADRGRERQPSADARGRDRWLQLDLRPAGRRNRASAPISFGTGFPHHHRQSAIWISWAWSEQRQQYAKSGSFVLFTFNFHPAMVAV